MNYPTMFAVGPEGTVIRGNVQDNGDGTYDIQYLPKKSGLYEMFLSIGCCAPHQVGFSCYFYYECYYHYYYFNYCFRFYIIHTQKNIDFIIILYIHNLISFFSFFYFHLFHFFTYFFFIIFRMSV